MFFFWGGGGWGGTQANEVVWWELYTFYLEVQAGANSVFRKLSLSFSVVSYWLQYATVDVHYVPLFAAVVCPGLFISPVFSSFFPLLPSDVPRLQKFLRSTVIKLLFKFNLLIIDVPFFKRRVRVSFTVLRFLVCFSGYFWNQNKGGGYF